MTRKLEQKVSYWLLPELKVRTLLTERIESLAHEFDGIEFIPHVTIGTAVNFSIDEVKALLSNISFNSPEVVLTPKGVFFGNNFTRSCFVEFKNDDNFFNLRSLMGISDTNTHPIHLSLFYGSLHINQKRFILESTSVDTPIRFSQIAAVITPINTKSNEDVKSWEMLEIAHLT